MTKAMRMMEDSVGVCDGIIYVLDARCPASSYNGNLKKTFGSRPVLYVLNKCDLGDGDAENFVKAIRQKGAACIKLNAVNANSRRDIAGAIADLIAEKQQKSLSKGYNKIFRFMVCGVPNTGKSTVINLLSREKRAVTGDKAGVTRGKQWIRCDGFELLDTPGVLWPKFEDREVGDKLAFIGSVKDEVTDTELIACRLLEVLTKTHPELIEARYKINDFSDLQSWEVLEMIGKKRGFLIKGGEIDTLRAAAVICDEFRGGKLGKISLELP